MIAAWGFRPREDARPATPVHRGLAIAAGIVLLASVMPSLGTQWRHCAYSLTPPRADSSAGCPSR